MRTLLLAAVLALTVPSAALAVTRERPVMVAGTPISLDDLRHWQRVSAIADGTPRRAGRTRHRHGAARLLISFVWLAKEARLRDIEVTRREVVRAYRRQTRESFPNEARFRRLLRETGQTRGDIRRQVRAGLLSRRIVDKVAGTGTGTEAERQERLDAFAKEFRTRWQAETTCSPRYHVRDSCRGVTRRGPAR